MCRACLVPLAVNDIAGVVDPQLVVRGACGLEFTEGGSEGRSVLCVPPMGEVVAVPRPEAARIIVLMASFVFTSNTLRPQWIVHFSRQHAEAPARSELRGSLRLPG